MIDYAVISDGYVYYFGGNKEKRNTHKYETDFFPE